MNHPAHRDARQLTELLRQQRELYRRLRELTARQSAAIAEDEPEGLLRVLAQRQQLIAELGQVNTLLEPLRSRWDELRQAMTPAQRLDVAQLIEQVQALLGQILQQDEADSDALRLRSRQVRQEAAAVSVGGRVNAAYAAQRYAAAGPRYLDRRAGEDGP